jgi:hypothetical protein
MHQQSLKVDPFPFTPFRVGHDQHDFLLYVSRGFIIVGLGPLRPWPPSIQRHIIIDSVDATDRSRPAIERIDYLIFCISSSAKHNLIDSQITELELGQIIQGLATDHHLGCPERLLSKVAEEVHSHGARGERDSGGPSEARLPTRFWLDVSGFPIEVCLRPVEALSHHSRYIISLHQYGGLPAPGCLIYVLRKPKLDISFILIVYVPGVG